MPTGPPSLGKPGPSSGVPGPGRVLGLPCSWALIPEQPGISSNHRQRADSQGWCCGKEGELSNVAGAPREGTDGQTAESAVGCGLLVCSWCNWCLASDLRSVCSMSFSNTLSLPQHFLNPAAWRTVRPDQGCPCYEVTVIRRYKYPCTLFCSVFQSKHFLRKAGHFPQYLSISLYILLTIPR